jgi:hypothetical protein
MPHGIREIKCVVCGHHYQVSRVHTIDGRTIPIEERAITGKAFCPHCGSPARWMQPAQPMQNEDEDS